MSVRRASVDSAHRSRSSLLTHSGSRRTATSGRQSQQTEEKHTTRSSDCQGTKEVTKTTTVTTTLLDNSDSRDISALLEEEYFDKSLGKRLPKTDYTYGDSASYKKQMVGRPWMSPNMSRRGIRNTHKEVISMQSSSMSDASHQKVLKNIRNTTERHRQLTGHSQEETCLATSNVRRRSTPDTASSHGSDRILRSECRLKGGGLCGHTLCLENTRRKRRHHLLTKTVRTTEEEEELIYLTRMERQEPEGREEEDEEEVTFNTERLQLLSRNANSSALEEGFESQHSHERVWDDNNSVWINRRIREEIRTEDEGSRRGRGRRSQGRFSRITQWLTPSIWGLDDQQSTNANTNRRSTSWRRVAQVSDEEDEEDHGRRRSSRRLRRMSGGTTSDTRWRITIITTSIWRRFISFICSCASWVTGSVAAGGRRLKAVTRSPSYIWLPFCLLYTLLVRLPLAVAHTITSPVTRKCSQWWRSSRQFFFDQSESTTVLRDTTTVTSRSSRSHSSTSSSRGGFLRGEEDVGVSAGAGAGSRRGSAERVTRVSEEVRRRRRRRGGLCCCCCLPLILLLCLLPFLDLYGTEESSLVAIARNRTLSIVEFFYMFGATSNTTDNKETPKESSSWLGWMWSSDKDWTEPSLPAQPAGLKEGQNVIDEKTLNDIRGALRDHHKRLDEHDTRLQEHGNGLHEMNAAILENNKILEALKLAIEAWDKKLYSVHDEMHSLSVNIQKITQKITVIQNSTEEAAGKAQAAEMRAGEAFEKATLAQRVETEVPRQSGEASAVVSGASIEEVERLRQKLLQLEGLVQVENTTVKSQLESLKALILANADTSGGENQKMSGELESLSARFLELNVRLSQLADGEGKLKEALAALEQNLEARNSQMVLLWEKERTTIVQETFEKAIAEAVAKATSAAKQAANDVVVVEMSKRSVEVTTHQRTTQTSTPQTAEVDMVAVLKASEEAARKAATDEVDKLFSSEGRLSVWHTKLTDEVKTVAMEMTKQGEPQPTSEELDERMRLLAAGIARDVVEKRTNEILAVSLKEMVDSTVATTMSKHEIKITEACSGGCGDGTGLAESRVLFLIGRALETFAADRVGRADYALESAGGAVVGTRCTQTYTDAPALISLFGIPLLRLSRSPRTLIEPSTQPGECWAFRGHRGQAVIQLATKINVTAVTLEHIPKSLSPNQRIDSAPKNFYVKGLANEKDQRGDMLGNFTYIDDGPAIQTFAVSNPRPFNYIELGVTSNYGNKQYTCVYRLRVHGVPEPH